MAAVRRVCLDAHAYLLLNPPSPPGVTANREGAGGLGVATPGPRGFVYAAQYLAEAAGSLEQRGLPHGSFDGVLKRRGLKTLLRSKDRARGFLVRTSLATRHFDKAWIQNHLGGDVGPRLVLGAPGQGVHRAWWEKAFPGMRLASGPTGFEAAALLLGEPFLEDPESWPFAAWEGWPLGQKKRLPLFHHRGCRFSCTYCAYVVATGRRLLTRSPERTLAELRFQVNRRQPRRVVFRDPVFGLERESSLRLLELLAGLPKRERVPFEVESRPECLGEEFLELFKRAGGVEVKLGVESLEAAPLIATRRVADVREAEAYRLAVRRVIERCRELGVTLRIYLLEDLPGNTAQGFEETLAAFRQEPLVAVKTRNAVPLPAVR